MRSLSNRGRMRGGCYFEAWLSLVERCVRDAEVASSNLVASILCESASAGIAQPVEHFTRNEGVVSSNLISSLPCKES